MKDSLVNLAYEIELEPGEKLTLPKSLIAQVDTEGLYDDYPPQ